MYVTSV